MPAVVEKTPPPQVSFEFNEKLKAPANFKDLTDDAEVKVILTGKVKDIAHGRNYDDKPYQRFSLEMTKVDIEIGGPKNLAQARSAAMKKAGG